MTDKDVFGACRVVAHIDSYRVRGALHVADHAVHRRRVLLQVLYRVLAGRDDELERRFGDISALAALRCPGVLPVLDCGRDRDGDAFVVMDLPAGELLVDVLARGPLPATTAAGVARGIASAVAAAHAGGLVHRSLTPCAVFADVAGRAPVTSVFDFGHGDVEVNASGWPGVMVLPPGLAYMAPEQYLGAAVGPAADVHALGCMLFEMLCGQTPFGDDLTASARRRPARDVRAVNAAVPVPLAALVAQLIAPEPDARPSMGEVPRALDAVAPSL